MAQIQAQPFGRGFFMPGKRAGSRIYFFNDGFYYHVQTARPESQFVQLRCSRRKRNNRICRGRAVMTRNGMAYYVSSNHNHAADYQYPLELELRRRIYQRLQAHDPTPFINIIREEGQRGGFPMEVRARLTGQRIRTAMYNVRAHHLPPIPFSLPLLGRLLCLPQFRGVTQTLDGQDNIFPGWCGNFADRTVSIVFVSRRNMALLQRHRKVFGDGTFKKRPQRPDSCQIFNITVVWINRRTGHKHILTLVRVFMQSRIQEAYVELFRFLMHLMPAWFPYEIMCDHEEAQVNAWMICFPHARIESCLWHFAVDVFKYARELQLYPLMQVDWVLDTIIRCLCALPLLPNYLLYAGLIAVGQWARVTGYMVMPAMRQLFEYMDREWMRRYPYLSVCGSEDRTNNVSESANACLQWDLRQNRPNVYDVIRAFVSQEDQIQVDVAALNEGLAANRSQRLTCLVNDHRILNLTENLQRGYITITQFLTSASRSLEAPYNFVFE